MDRFKNNKIMDLQAYKFKKKLKILGIQLFENEKNNNKLFFKINPALNKNKYHT